MVSKLSFGGRYEIDPRYKNGRKLKDASPVEMPVLYAMGPEVKGGNFGVIHTEGPQPGQVRSCLLTNDRAGNHFDQYCNDITEHYYPMLERPDERREYNTDGDTQALPLPLPEEKEWLRQFHLKWMDGDPQAKDPSLRGPAEKIKVIIHSSKLGEAGDVVTKSIKFPTAWFQNMFGTKQSKSKTPKP